MTIPEAKKLPVKFKFYVGLTEVTVVSDGSQLVGFFERDAIDYGCIFPMSTPLHEVVAMAKQNLK